MEQQHVQATGSRSPVGMIVAAIIALAAIIFGVYMSKKASTLESQVNLLTKEKDSLSRVVADQAKLLDAEGDQFQEDLLKIDSLENAK